MTHFVIGTAGHEKHGKTALVKALVDFGRDQGIQVGKKVTLGELEFSSLTLSSSECDVIDVPGHIRHIKKMLTSAALFDFAILTVDASEGIKPQTIEHLEILELLKTKGGIIAITKTDLAQPDKIAEIETEIGNLVKGTFLSDSPIIKTSSMTGEGIRNLIKFIDKGISKLQPANENETFRFPILNVQEKPEIGTFITGKAYKGMESVNSSLFIVPSGVKARIRGISYHGKEIPTIAAGTLASINIGKVFKSKIRFGSQAACSGPLRPINDLDVALEVLESSPFSLMNKDKLRFYIFTAEAEGNAILLDSDELKPGEKGYARLHFEEPVAALQGDRFIIRREKSPVIIGGGKVIDPSPGFHRRFDKATIDLLRMKDEKSPSELIEIIMDREPYKVFNIESIASEASMPVEVTGETISVMERKNLVYKLGPEKMVLNSTIEKLSVNFVEILNTLQIKEPGQPGRDPDELKKNLPKMDDRLFREILIKLKKHEKITENFGRLSTTGFIPTLTEEQEKCRLWMKKLFEETGFTPPSRDELLEMPDFKKRVINGVIEYFIHTGELIPIDARILFTKERLGQAKRIVANSIVRNGEVSPAEVREILGSTRKYVIPLLEYFDNIHFTRRKNDKRVFFRENVIIETP